MGNGVTKFRGGEIPNAPTTYWWNLTQGAENRTNATIYDVAFNAIRYADHKRDLSLMKDAGGLDIAKAHGLSFDQFEKAMRSPEQRGSIVFSRLDPNWTEAFSEVNSAAKSGLQTALEVEPYRVQQIPDFIDTRGGSISKILTDSTGKVIKKEGLILSQLSSDESMYDWMKTFAQNVKDTMGPNATLPAGTQELIDAPTRDEANAALRKYLTGKYGEDYHAGSKITKVIPDENGLLTYTFDGAEEGKTYRVRMSSITDNLSRQEAPSAINLGSKVKKNDFVPKLIYGRNPLANPDAIVGGAEHMVQAVHPQTGEVVGKMTWWEKTVANAGEIDKIDVAENYRRMGIGTSMLNKAKELSQIDENIPFPIHSATRTEMGEAWARSTGDILPPRVGEEAAVAARVSSRAVAETVEEGVEKVVRHSGATGRLLGAATEASAAVAGGINSAGALRNIGTALTVLRGRL